MRKSKSEYETNKTYFKSLFAHISDVAPTGIPLYKYKCTGNKYDQIELFLKLQSDVITQKHSAPPYISEIFVFYVAEWVRRNHQSGHIKWADIRYALGWNKATDSTLSYLAKTGIRAWRRGILRRGGKHAYLHTLQVEGGLPLKMLQNYHGALAKYFRHIIDALKNTVNSPDATDVAETYKALLPVSLQIDLVYSIAGNLCSVVVNLMHESNAYGVDVVEKFELHDPLWFERLPILLSKEEATGFVRNIFSATQIQDKGAKLTFKVDRQWVKNDREWHCEARFNLPNQIINTKLISGFFADEFATSRLLLKAVLQDRVIDLALLSKVEQDWSVEPFPEANTVIVGFAAQQRIHFELFDGLHCVADVVPKGGEGFPKDLPWVMQPINGSDYRFKVIGSGSLSTTYDSVFIALPQGASLAPYSNTVCQLPQMFSGFDRTVIETSSECQIILSSGDKCVIRTSIVNVSERYYMFGRQNFKFARSDLPMFCSFPILFAVEEENPTLIPARQLFWRVMRQGNGTWYAYDEMEPLGKIELRHVINGEVLHSTQCVILPNEFNILSWPSNSHSGKLIFDGIEKHALIGITPNSTLTVNHSTDNQLATLMLTTKATTPKPVDVTFNWHNKSFQPAVLNIDFPAYGAFFIKNGDVISNNSLLCIDDLYDLTAKLVHSVNQSGDFLLVLKVCSSQQSPINQHLKLSWKMFETSDTSHEIQVSPLKRQIESLLNNLPRNSKLELLIQGSITDTRLFIRNQKPYLAHNEGLIEIEGDIPESSWLQAMNLNEPSNKIALASDELGNYSIAPLLLNKSCWAASLMDGEQQIGNQIIIDTSEKQDSKQIEAFSHQAELIKRLSQQASKEDWADLFEQFKAHEAQAFSQTRFANELVKFHHVLIGMLLHSVSQDLFEEVLDLEKSMRFHWAGFCIQDWTLAATNYVDYVQCIDMPDMFKTVAFAAIEEKLVSLSKLDMRILASCQVVRKTLGMQIDPVSISKEEYLNAVQQLIRLQDELSPVRSFDYNIYLAELTQAQHKKLSSLFPYEQYEWKSETLMQHVFYHAALSLLSSTHYSKFTSLFPIFDIAYQQAPPQLGVIFNYYLQELA